MWIGDTIYFSSDRRRYAQPVQRTTSNNGRNHSSSHSSTTWDVRWPSDDGEGRIVYELNGELEVYDTRDGSVAPISITVPNDGVAMRPSRVSSAPTNIEGFALSPGGERALFVARGDVFTAPIEKGPTRNLTQLLRRTRQACRVVPRRDAHRLHQRSERERSSFTS